jgi:hypothetical protein
MAEVFVQFDEPVTSPEGRAFVPRVVGRQREDGRWEGWIEFVPGGGDPVLRTAQETVQLKRDDLMFWATGLSATYLEGALERVLEPLRIQPRTLDVRPTYDEPAPAFETAPPPRPASSQPRPLLDPFDVYAQGEDLLRKQLNALSADHLRDIVKGYALVGEEELDLRELGKTSLVDLIVAAVRKREE